MDFTYKYKTISVEHLKELQEIINNLDHQGKLSKNERYRNYLNPERFTVPGNFLDAKSIIVIARFSPLMKTNFHLHDNTYEIMSPPESYDTGMTDEAWIKLIEANIIKQHGYRIEGAERILLKSLAVRSGLGKYGRNNICYVDEMGSFISLHGFFTDFEFAEDNWQEVSMMDDCESCDICMQECPCSCIREENFVVDATKCVTWYNERKGEFPEWINPDIHNSLLGCIRCQMYCPANNRAMKFTGRFEDVLEEDTSKILEGKIDRDVLKSSVCKIFGISTESELKDWMPIIKRNLGVLIK